MDVGIKAANDQFQSLTTVERTAIAVPVVGQCVWDSDLRQIMVYMNATTGNAWQPIGNSIVCASTTRPVTPFEGQRIYETDTNRSWTYNGAAFVPNDNVFTDEAARDAAITSPTEGMHAYLTASTVAAATGVVTAVPTGIQTIYNGANWVCVTEVGASSTTSANSSSSAYASTLSGDATAISVTLSTGTTAKIEHGFWGSTGTGILNEDFVISGATTRAANDTTRIIHQQTAGTGNMAQSPFKSFVITGLTAGTNTFTLQYKTDGSTQTWVHRVLTVKGIA